MMIRGPPTHRIRRFWSPRCLFIWIKTKQQGLQAARPSVFVLFACLRLEYLCSLAAKTSPRLIELREFPTFDNFNTILKANHKSWQNRPVKSRIYNPWKLRPENRKQLSTQTPNLSVQAIKRQCHRNDLCGKAKEQRRTYKTANLGEQTQFNRTKTVFFQYTQSRKKNDEKEKDERKMYFVTFILFYGYWKAARKEETEKLLRSV